MVELKGLRLPTPKLIFKSPQTLSVSNGGWNLTRCDAFQTPSVGCKGIFVFSCELEDNEADSTTDDQNAYGVLLKAIEKKYHMSQKISVAWQNVRLLPKILTPKQLQRYSLTPGQDPPSFRTRCETAFDAAFKALKDQRHGDPSLLLMILPKRDLNFYAEVKRWSDCSKGIPSQCVVRSNFVKLIEEKYDSYLRTMVPVKADKSVEANIW